MKPMIGDTTALRHAWLWAILTGGYSCLTALKQYPPFNQIPDLPLVLDAPCGFAMGLLIMLRTNRAYERWWEARTQWGALVNVSRNLAIKVRRHVSDPAERDRMRILIVANSHALKNHLRDESQLSRLSGFEDNDSEPSHVPAFLVSQIYALTASWHRTGRLDGAELWIVDREARKLIEICGACERIKTTLMSVSWRVITRQCILLYLLVFPWGLVEDFGLWTIAVSSVIGYFIFGAEGIASYVEEPFGTSEDHLDLEAICDGIEKSVNQIMTD